MTTTHFILPLYPINHFQSTKLFCYHLGDYLFRGVFLRVFGGTNEVKYFEYRVDKGKGVRPASPQGKNRGVRTVPHGSNRRCQFSTFYGTILQGRTQGCRQGGGHLLSHRGSFDILSLRRLKRLADMSRCPDRRFMFSSCNYSLRVSGRLITGTFTTLPGRRRDVLVLFYILRLNSNRVNSLVKVSQDTMRHRQAGALGILQGRLGTRLPRKN